MTIRLIALFSYVLAAAGAAERPNFLFLFADDQRPDTIAALGNERIDTPHLDMLVAGGLTFTRANCSNPICVASRAELLTGTHGWTNGVESGLREDKVTWWADTLGKSGYLTGYVGKWHTRGNVHDRGFEKTAGFYQGGGGRWWEPQTDWKGFPITGYRGWVFQDSTTGEKYPELGVGLTPDISRKFADAAIEWLEEATSDERPFFLSVNFTAPHDPLFVPPGLEGKYRTGEMKLPANFAPWHPFDHGNYGGRDEELLAWPRTEEAVRDLLRVYYSVIDDMDRQIGRILAALEEGGDADNTYIIFSSDHGMSCGSHGLRGKQNMYEHTINVPLIIAGPGIEAGTRTGAQVYLRELYPTTCELADVPVPDKVTATSFAPVLRGESDSHHESIFGFFRGVQRMVRREDGWKLIYYPHLDRRQVFHVGRDPDELNDLSGEQEIREVEAGLWRELEEWREKEGDPLLSTGG